jgi:hypothetical protein
LKRSRHVDAKRLGGYKIDDQFEGCRCTTGRSAGFSPLTMRPASQLNFADLNSGLGIGVVGNIGQGRLRVRGKGCLEGVG